MKFCLTLCTTMFVLAAQAAEYDLIVPNPPGSSSDIVARTIASEYTRITGNKLILTYVPGADHIMAANRVKNTKKLTVSLGTTTMHAFNHVYKDNLSYEDKDFHHVAWLGWSPHVWYVRNDSRYGTLRDVNEALAHSRVNVAVDALSTQANVTSLQKYHRHGQNAHMIHYKGSPQALTDVLGGHVDLAVSSLSIAIVELAKADKIRLLATTNKTPQVVAEQSLPTAQDIFQVPQVNGGFIISISPGYDTKESQNLKTALLSAIMSEHTKQSLAKIMIEIDPVIGDSVQQIIDGYRQILRKIK